MKINIFGLNKNENWKEVEKALYQVWCMNQTDTMLPKFLDRDFDRCFNNVKRQYGYNKLIEKLGL